MNKLISAIPNHVQDRTSDAWRSLCEYIDDLAKSGREEFTPLAALGPELYFQLYTLPESIGSLKGVKKILLYGSKLKRIPPEIGQMESLENFIPYTSYDLHWFPYELTHCKNLKSSVISTRALYGNYKNRKGFPNLKNNPVRYDGSTLYCSVCRKAITYNQTNQLWITLSVATDYVPLLANVCSKACEESLGTPPDNYIPTPHKGGARLQQPADSDGDFAMNPDEAIKSPDLPPPANNEKEKSTLLKLIRKIWGK